MSEMFRKFYINSCNHYKYRSLFSEKSSLEFLARHVLVGIESGTSALVAYALLAFSSLH